MDNPPQELTSKDAAWKQIFANPQAKEVYMSLRSSKMMRLFPRIVLFSVCAFAIIRRLQLSYQEGNSPEVKNAGEGWRSMVLMGTGFLLELLTHLFDRLAWLRCVIANIVLAYISTKWSLSIHYSCPTLVPVYPYSNICVAALLPILGTLMCHSWIAIGIASVIGHIIMAVYGIAWYNLSYSDIVVMVLVNVLSSVAAFYMFYFVEYGLRFAAVQYALKGKETQNWKNMMDMMPQGVLIRKANKIVYVNHSLCKLLETSLAELNNLGQEVNGSSMRELGQSRVASSGLVGRISNAQTTLYDFIMKDNEQGDKKAHCFQYKTDTGIEKRLVAETSIGIFDGTECVICTVEDHTTIMELEHQCLSKKFEKMFFSSFIHEMVTPVNGIMGMLEILPNANEPAERTRIVEAAKSACKLFLNLVTDSINFAKENLGAKASVIKESFSLKDLVSEWRQLLEFEFEHKGLEMVADVQKTVPTIIYTDRVRYMQVILHLLSNAVKYTMKGQIVIRISYDGKNRLLSTSVEDTGIGISPQEISRIFTLFGKLDNTCELNPQGIGLGLSICQRYSRMLGGNITLHSELGKGSVFTLTIPIETDVIPQKTSYLYLEEEGKEPRPSEDDMDESVVCHIPYNFAHSLSHASSQSSTTFKKPHAVSSAFSHEAALMRDTMLQQKRVEPQKCGCSKFLIVDDNELNRFATQGLLKGIRERGDEALNGLQAVEKVQARRQNLCCRNYKLIFMDINMPVMNGVEATAVLKRKMGTKEIPFTPIVALTAAHCDSDADKAKYTEAGFDEFVEKPFTAAKLRGLLAKIFTSKG